MASPTLTAPVTAATSTARATRVPGTRPGWARPALLALLAGTAVLYL